MPIALHEDLQAALDPAVLAKRAGFTLDEWQARALRSVAPRVLMNCSRQSGKSSVAALIATAEALYRPGSLTLLLSPTLRQSGELFKKVAAVYGSLAREVSADSQTALTLTLENGSRIVSLPGKEGTIRGYSGVGLLVVDEAAWCADSLYMTVRPMLAVSAGRLVALSTPFGTRGWWYEAWRGAEPWERYEVPAPLCPRIPASFLEEERRNMGEWWFNQEYLCQFLDAENQPFRREDVDRAFVEEVEAWNL